jgi:hypothetical protein
MNGEASDEQAMNITAHLWTGLWIELLGRAELLNLINALPPRYGGCPVRLTQGNSSMTGVGNGHDYAAIAYDAHHRAACQALAL